ncbi:hypothetical protein [Desulforamulus hydrothermalis]|uniref:Uncharacterized protein n=1 Tax=Desulforamulus hydrothermalis Lam5 = DSM 18033 TaxID=1121428 RepID=K8DYP4_9FIRM|nr:hypothetical protein [Desulforamulus hydrothermalis]CCO08057.1 hypothetical protein DESHY_160181 [Desulforamulus hydrothermalis Lam5 = DSM 18033]SHG83079.1 hypothetical protein SAMN02745177_00494 [Desulforamulus hydrothermalis Lam5 = DSM 18033]
MQYGSNFLHSLTNAAGETEYWRISLVRLGNGFILGTACGPDRQVTIPCYLKNDNIQEALQTMLQAITEIVAAATK